MIDIEQVMKSVEAEEKPAYTNTVSPELLSDMIAVYDRVIADRDPSEKYLIALNVVREILSIPGVDIKPAFLPGVIFVYYLKLLQATHATLPHDASLALFDIVVDDKVHNVFRLVFLSGVEALTTVIMTNTQKAGNADFNAMLDRTVFVNMIATSLRKASLHQYRVKNIAYITWCREFFRKSLYVPDLSFISSDETVRAVREQLVKQCKVIKV